MDRRKFIGRIGGALAIAGAARAQQSGKVFRLGWLETTSDVGTPLGNAFDAAMRERGWIEGQNFTVERLLSEGHSERFPALATDLVRRKLDLIVTAGTGADHGREKTRPRPSLSFSTLSATLSGRDS
jgi:putative ABC transport system substrate-binding protein